MISLIGLNIVCFAAYALLLHRYSRQHHIFVSVPVSRLPLMRLVERSRILASLFADVLCDSAYLTERLLALEGEPEKQFAYIVQEAHSLGQSRKVPPHFGRHIVHMVRTHVAAMLNYQPKPYPGFLLFFRPSEAASDYSAHADMAWLPLTAKGANVYTVPGNHITVNMEPNVQSITAHLQRYIIDNLGYRPGEEVPN